MAFCSNCGHPQDGSIAAPAEVPESDEVRIARIQADRDVKVAQLAAKQEREWNESREVIAETEAGAAVEVAVAEAEVIGTIIAAETAEPEAEPEPLPAPVIVEAEPEESDAPPVIEDHEPVSRKPRGLGMW